MKKGTSSEKIKIAVLIIAVVVFILAIFQISTILEFSFGDVSENAETSRMIEYNGVRYKPNNNIMSLLVMGIDEEGKVNGTGSYRNEGLADFISVIAFDVKEKTCAVLQIDRDTMTEITTLGPGGIKTGTATAQIAAAHTYGSGLQDSCINTKSAVSSLLNNISISNYISIHMDGLAILNDSVGGVSVTVKDDFSAVDPTLIKGETIILKGKQALTFVRSRIGVENQTNIERMERQKEYMNSFYKKFSEKISENKDSLSSMLKELNDYIITDCNTGTLTLLSDRVKDFRFKGVVTIEGETVVGESGFAEFYPDKDSLTQRVIDIFYMHE